jgi:microcystin-dependent protein
MAYNISFTDAINKGTITIEDNTVNNQTSVNFPGKNTTSYGTVISENFLQLLENFANSTAPLRPIEGQLWFDNAAGVNQLKVYDGANWVASGGLKKAINQPSASESISGDLWVDTNAQQLYLFTGSGWILIGPQYSQGLTTGATPISIIGTDDLSYSIVKLEVEAQTVAIISKSSFTPKITIPGFSALNPGVNLSLTNFGSDVNKLYGTSEKAESLVVGNTTVAAGNFLRSDTTSLTDFPIKIKTDQGLEVGSAGTFKMFVENQAGIIQLGTQDEEIDFRLNSGGSVSTVMRISSQQQVGINNTNPNEALDVTGNILSSGTIVSNSTSPSINIGSGAIVSKGGLGVALSANIGGSGTFAGDITAQSVLPSQNLTYNIGSTTNRYNTVYANQIQAGSVVTSSITGNATSATSADKLAQATTFRLAGDVTAVDVSFDGQTGGTTKTFTTSINNSFIGNQTLTTTSNVGDEIIINRTSGSTGIYKTTVGAITNAIPTPPVASMMPYAGTTAPTDWLFCDGAELQRSVYNQLFQTIGTQYGTPSSSATFKLPDMRGRFPLGKDNMSNPGLGQGSADRVTSPVADGLGLGAGNETKTIAKENLPNHEHDLKADNGDQFFAGRNIAGTSTDPEVTTTSGPDLSNANGAQQLPNSGGIDGTIGQAMDVMNPYLTLNYIIYTGGA